jgi:glycosyltransferase involved in cell wall biosynthesis
MKPLMYQSAATVSKLMLFDLALGGHHGNYIQHIIDYAHQQNFTGEIDIVVLPQFFETHRDTVEVVSNYKYPVVNFVPISETASAILGSRSFVTNRALRNFREWDIFCKYAQKLQTTYALVMYLDTYALPIAFGQQSPCSFSGIYFRPTFHYNTFVNYQPSWKKMLQHWREKITLDLILRRSKLHGLLCLDPFAVRSLKSHQHSHKVIHLADPVDPKPAFSLDIKCFQEKLGIEPHRRVFLLFGALDERKGIYQLLDAVKLLPPEITQNFCLLIVGKTNATEQAKIQPKISAICQKQPVQIVEVYDFIPESEVPKYFQSADIVLATYQRHVGMSGILLLAAAAGKPVLSSNYGLMGELVVHYHMGLAVDSTVPAQIAQAFSRCVLEAPETFCDRNQMKMLAEQNSIKLYTSTIFQYITGADQPVSSKAILEI